MKIQRNLLKKMFKKKESGRSMVEMLGVLAIIGVLSIGGIAGYRTAMIKKQANNLMNDLDIEALYVSSQILSGVKANALSISRQGMRENYLLSIDSENTSQDSFVLQVENVPYQVCREVYERHWKEPKSIDANGGNAPSGIENCGNSGTITMWFEFDARLSAQDNMDPENPAPDPEPEEPTSCETASDCSENETCGASCVDGHCQSVCNNGSSCAKEEEGNDWTCCTPDYLSKDGRCCVYPVMPDGTCCPEFSFATNTCCSADEHLVEESAGAYYCCPKSSTQYSKDEGRCCIGEEKLDVVNYFKKQVCCAPEDYGLVVENGGLFYNGCCKGMKRFQSVFCCPPESVALAGNTSDGIYCCAVGEQVASYVLNHFGEPMEEFEMCCKGTDKLEIGLKDGDIFGPQCCQAGDVAYSYMFDGLSLQGCSSDSNVIGFGVDLDTLSGRPCFAGEQVVIENDTTYCVPL